MGEKYKLTTFHSRGIGEFIAVLFKYADVEFEDNRIDKEQWPQFKAQQPFGKLPVLQVGDTVIAESGAIYRYLARKFGLAGKDDLEAAQADMYLEAIRDLISNRRQYVHETDEAKKEEMMKQFLAEKLPPFLDSVEKALKENESAYLVGKDLTYADIGMAIALSEIIKHTPSVLEKHPALKELTEKVMSIPNMKKWIESSS